jgi:putative ABC transport system substrate-binding protein
MGLQIQSQEFREPSDLDRAFSGFARERADALIVLDDVFTILHATRVAELAIRHRLPTMHGFREATVAGGLMSYGPSGSEMLNLCANYIVKILKGASLPTFPSNSRRSSSSSSTSKPRRRSGSRSRNRFWRARIR